MPAARLLILLAIGVTATLGTTVPTDIQQPGTQPQEVTELISADVCALCHGFYSPTPEIEPTRGWEGSMMAHAARDPLFWACLAIAEQDFSGSGDLCLRCHSPGGWLGGRSEPTDGSALSQTDGEGVTCHICHRLTNPDDSEHVGTQNPPFIANSGGSEPEGFYGSGMMSVWPGDERLGPYVAPAAAHLWLQSDFHRSSEMCGTCHDVSNPAVGDLAHNNGAQQPLPAGSFSGTPGAPVAEKAAFKNLPFQYGVIERTFSEHKASALAQMRVSAYQQLPRDLQRGAIKKAYDAATAGVPSGDYEDGTPRFFSCQTCHMRPATGEGCGLAGPIRKDLPRHELTGGNYWAPEAIKYLDARSRLRAGGGLTYSAITAMDEGMQRARDNLEDAAALDVRGDVLKVTNLTGHKLISGYPEGRRMWLNIKWFDDVGNLVREDGEYGQLSVMIQGQPTQVETIRDLSAANTQIYQAKMGITQEWATQLIDDLTVSPSLALSYDRVTGQVTKTLGQLAAQAPGTSHETFHFVLNNTIISDNRIPPYGMSYDEAKRRNALPVPETQFGNPSAGGVYRYFDEFLLSPPAGADYATIDLLYQPTSWEYVQFLQVANNGSSAFLATAGDDVVEAWLNTEMAEPHVMATAGWCRRSGSNEDLTLASEVNSGGNGSVCLKTAGAGDVLTLTATTPRETFLREFTAVLLQAYPQGMPPGSFPGFSELHLERIDVALATPQLSPAGFTVTVGLPAGIAGYAARFQAVALTAAAENGLFAASPAHDVLFQ